MNKRNFGRVIKRIEADISLWRQTNVPRGGDHKGCGSPYCFIGHAEFIRSKGRRIAPPWVLIWDMNAFEKMPRLLKWLGMSASETYQLFWSGGATLKDFRRWHKAGKVT